MREKGISCSTALIAFLLIAWLNLGIERKSLVTLLFHGIVTNDNELKTGLIKPNYVLSANTLSNTIDYFLSKGYIFTSPDNIAKGLAESKKYVLLTFDDGYFNNSLALPILEEYCVPATFFISSSFVENNKGFWWDVIYRERSKRKTPLEKIYKEFVSLERAKINAIEDYIVKNFGLRALKPVCDIDRPFSASELKKFSGHMYVTLGNHTSNHTVLTILNRQEIIEEFTACQSFINSINDSFPMIISYPMGYYNQEIAKISKECGFILGFTVNERKNYLPLQLNSIDTLLLNRFTPLICENWKRQLLSYRTDYRIKKTIKRIFF